MSTQAVFVRDPALRITATTTEVRASVQELLSFIASAKTIAMPVHTTRGLPPPVPTFAAGRFGVAIEGATITRHLVFQTEGRVGHLAPVVVGKTRIDGSVASSDPTYRQLDPLTPCETEALLVALARRAATDTSPALAELLKYTWAIVSNGRGVEPLRVIYDNNGLPQPRWMQATEMQGQPSGFVW